MRTAFEQVGTKHWRVMHDGEFVGNLYAISPEYGATFYSFNPSEYEEGEYRADNLTNAQYLVIGWCTSELEG